MLHLQVAQLKRVISEINTIHQESILAFEGMSNEVSELVRDLAGAGLWAGSQLKNREAGEDDHSDPSSSTGMTTEDPFVPLRSALLRLHQILDQSRDLFEQIQRTAVRASETTERLTSSMEQVRLISLETHIKALNAIVKAARLGEEGRPLVVLAQEMKELSDQSSTFVANMEGILASMATSSQALRPTISYKSKEMSLSGDARVSLDESTQEISCAYVQFEEDSLNAFQRAETLKNVISRARADLAFLPALANKLTGHVVQLEEITQTLNPWASYGDKDLAAEVDKLTERYTMQRERVVHRQVIKQIGDSGDEDEDDLGDNVELF
jgi:hypothetical protein